MTDTRQKTLFLLGCVPARLGVAYLVRRYGAEHTDLVAGLLALVGVGLLSLFVTRSRMHAIEGGGVTWWHHLRPVHGLLYLASAAAVMTGHVSGAVSLLLVDVAIGLAAHVLYHRW